MARAGADKEKNQLEPIIDITIPRECIYKAVEKDDPGPCPRCGSTLQQRSQSYLVATMRGDTMADPFLMGGKFGWFCPDCPTVVINLSKVREILSYSKSDWDMGSEFFVAGVVDLDAVPEEKKHIPLGEDDNPITLIKFTHVSSEESASPRQLTGRSKSNVRKKRPKPAQLQAKQKKKKKKRRRR